MKNWKVRNKLRASFGVILFLMFGILLLSLYGMQLLHSQNLLLETKTLANISYVWEMRREMISTQRYMLLALESDDPEEIKQALETADINAANREAVLAKYMKNYSVEKEKVERVNQNNQPMAELRKRIASHIALNTAQGNAKAKELFDSLYKPLQDKTADMLKEISDDEIALAAVQINSAERVFKISIAVLIAVFVAALLVCVFVVSRLMKSILNPLRELETSASALSQGDFSTAIAYSSRDEFGQVCENMQKSFNSLKRIIREISVNGGKLSEGDFTIQLSMSFPGELKAIELSMGQLVQKLNTSFAEIKLSVAQITEGSNQVASGSQSLAQGTTEQASNIEMLSASLEEVSTQVAANAKSAKKASLLTAEAGDAMNETLASMQEMLEAMGQISAATESINKIIKVIDDIAFQTNILALNATVEAARAGTSGKGFAVVAGEVRNLAQKCAGAASETTDMIERSIKAVVRGESIARRTNDTLENVAVKARDVITTVSEISAASEQQAGSIKDITAGIEQISSVVQTNAATSEQSAAASEQLSSQASMLDSLVRQFKLADDSSY